MNHAPAVQYPVGRSVWAFRFHMAVMALWLLGQLAWVLAGDRSVWPGAWWFATFVGGLYAVWVYGCLRRPACGQLQWRPDPLGASGWYWQSPAYQRGIALELVYKAMDAQNVLLLRARTAAGLTVWLWLEQVASPEHWETLRRALQAHAFSGARSVAQNSPHSR